MVTFVQKTFYFGGIPIGTGQSEDSKTRNSPTAVASVLKMARLFSNGRIVPQTLKCVTVPWGCVQDKVYIPSPCLEHYKSSVNGHASQWQPSTSVCWEQSGMTWNIR